MFLKTTVFAAVAAISFAVPALAGSDITIEYPYARASGMSAKAGAAFMQITNNGNEDDRLIEVRADIAKKIELHTHIEKEGGIMQMREVEGGFVIPAGSTHMLMRGGDHVMFMGLTRPMLQGDSVSVTMVFEKAGEIVVEIPVDLERKPVPRGMQINHGSGG